MGTLSRYLERRREPAPGVGRREGDSFAAREGMVYSMENLQKATLGKRGGVRK
jgi:hypothetical protein